MRLTSSWHHQVHVQTDTVIGPWLPGPSIVLLCSLQGSYRCGPCKPGYIGDQMRGCKMERNCRDPELNPCSVNAQCIEEAHWWRVQRDAPLRCSQRPSACSMTAGEHPRGARNEVLKTRCRVNSSQRGKGPRSQTAQMFPEHRLHPWLEYTSQTSVQLEPALMTAHRHRHRHTHTHTHIS